MNKTQIFKNLVKFKNIKNLTFCKKSLKKLAIFKIFNIKIAFI